MISVSCASLDTAIYKTTLTKKESSVKASSVGDVYMNQDNCLPFIEVAEARIETRLYLLTFQKDFPRKGLKYD